MRDDLEAGLEAFVGLAAQFLDLVVGELGQDRFPLGGGIGAAAGNFDGVLQRLGQIGEKGHHLGFGLEVVLRRQAAARLLLVDIGALGDADQGVVRLVHLGLGEVDVVGGDDGKAQFVREIDGPAFSPRLVFRQCAAGSGVSLEFDVEAVRVDLRQALQDRAGLGVLAGGVKAAERTFGAAGEADQALSVLCQFVQRHLWQVRGPGHRAVDI
jgi:hypothetical protein